MNKLAYISQFPPWVQNIFVGLWGKRIQQTRYNRRFWEILSELENRLSWSENEIEEFQNERLREMIKHCYESVPFYQEQFKALKLKPQDINTKDDLLKLPIINRKILNQNKMKFLSTAIPKKNWRHLRSGGTTGFSLDNIVTKERIQRMYATWWRFRRQHGIDFGTWCAIWAQTPIVPPQQKRPPYWRVNRPGYELRLSISHLNNMTFNLYLREIQKRHIPWIHGHPTLIGLLAEYMLRTNTSAKELGIKWISTGGENLLERHTKLIEEAFDIRPIQHYGNSEGIANFSECLEGSLHVDEDYSIVEFIGFPTSGDRKLNTIVGTTLWNPAMPLLRYDIGDLASLSEKSCPCGGWGRVVKSLDGRQNDFAICSDGTRVTGFNWVFSVTRNIESAQIYQEIPGRMIVRIVRSPGFGVEDEKMLLKALRNRISEEKMELEIEYVKKIELTPSGKHRMVVSKI